MPDPQISNDNVTALPGKAFSTSVPPSTAGTSGGDSHIPDDMNVRVSKLEGEFGDLKQSQMMLITLNGVIAAIVAILLGLAIYTLTKLDQTGDKIDKAVERTVELPGKIGAELREITRTLADVITASKQAPPQIIVIPAPVPLKEQQPKQP